MTDFNHISDNHPVLPEIEESYDHIYCLSVLLSFVSILLIAIYSYKIFYHNNTHLSLVNQEILTNNVEVNTNNVEVNTNNVEVNTIQVNTNDIGVNTDSDILKQLETLCLNDENLLSRNSTNDTEDNDTLYDKLKTILENKKNENKDLQNTISKLNEKLTHQTYSITQLSNFQNSILNIFPNKTPEEIQEQYTQMCEKLKYVVNAESICDNLKKENQELLDINSRLDTENKILQDKFINYNALNDDLRKLIYDNSLLLNKLAETQIESNHYTTLFNQIQTALNVNTDQDSLLKIQYLSTLIDLNNNLTLENEALKLQNKILKLENQSIYSNFSSGSKLDRKDSSKYPTSDDKGD